MRDRVSSDEIEVLQTLALGRGEMVVGYLGKRCDLE